MPLWQHVVAAVLALAGSAPRAEAQDAGQVVGFESSRWTVTTGRVVEAFGRRAFMGTATLGDVDFGDGVIEFDMAASSDRVRSYPGVTFRATPGGRWERVYLRPHRSALYGDVLQYVAAFNGVDSWQLYNGPGATAPAVVPVGQWLHVKLEVAGSQARVYLGSASEPSLVVPRLRHGASRGAIGVMGPADGSAYFSNFSYRSGGALLFAPSPPPDEVPGVVRDWQVSRVFAADAIDLEKTPEQQGLKEVSWARLSAEPSGLVDISRLRGRIHDADAVFARATITADTAGTRKFDIGYSDAVTVLLNGRPVFSGNSQYQGRDSSFLGIAGWFDSVFLPLRRGPNELTLVVAETSGGWGFEVRDAGAVFAASGVARSWRTGKVFAVPESVAYDNARGCLYVSNYDPADTGGPDQGQAVAKLAPDGRVLDARWVTGLRNPTGLVVAGNRLFAVERKAIAEIDIQQRRIAARYPIPDAALPNDIAAAPDGSLYVSDSQRAAIYRLAEGSVTVWLQDRRLARPNGVIVDGPRLVVGTNGDGCLKAVDLSTKAITTIAALGPGLIDGLAVLDDGEYLVSHNEGRLFRVGRSGRIDKLLDTSVVGWPIADFSVVGRLVVFPTFTDGRVMAYRLPAANGANEPGAGEPRPAGEPARVRGVTAPIVLDHNRMLVGAEIRSKDGSWLKARLWVDSGSPEFILSERFARALGFEAAVSAASPGPSPASLPPVAVRIGGVPIDVDGLAPIVRPGVERLWPTMHADGNLPATVLRRYAVVLDYPGRRLELRPPGQATHRGLPVPLRVHPETGIAQVDAVIGDTHLELALDVGASYSFVTTEVATALVTGHPAWSRTEGALGCANIWGLWPQEDHWQVVRAPGIRLGDARISGVGIVGLPPVFGRDPDIGTWYSHKTAAPVVGFLGPNAFRAFRVEIDYLGGRLSLERRAADDVRDMDMVGLTLQPDGRSWRVLRAQVAGVEAGDILLDVGGRRLSGATMGTAVDALRGRPGDRRVLVLERQGRRLRVVAHVRRFLP